MARLCASSHACRAESSRGDDGECKRLTFLGAPQAGASRRLAISLREASVSDGAVARLGGRRLHARPLLAEGIDLIRTGDVRTRFAPSEENILVLTGLLRMGSIPPV